MFCKKWANSTRLAIGSIYISGGELKRHGHLAKLVEWPQGDVFRKGEIAQDCRC